MVMSTKSDGRIGSSDTSADSNRKVRYEIPTIKYTPTNRYRSNRTWCTDRLRRNRQRRFKPGHHCINTDNGRAGSHGHGINCNSCCDPVVVISTRCGATHSSHPASASGVCAPLRLPAHQTRSHPSATQLPVGCSRSVATPLCSLCAATPQPATRSAEQRRSNKHYRPRSTKVKTREKAAYTALSLWTNEQTVRPLKVGREP
jgi:hypothetical protein